MKTIVHVVLSDLERNHLACVWDDKYSSRLVSRNEVTTRAQTHFREELAQYAHPDQVIPEPDSTPDAPAEGVDEDQPDSVGTECTVEHDGTLPDATELSKACECVIEHISRHFDDELYPLNVGWCCSILVATGVK